MEDVIFAGTAKRKPQGAATVSPELRQQRAGALGRKRRSDHHEKILPLRRQRVPLINGEQVRLKDVNELFMDTGLGKDGYSMIGQGKIAEIVGAKSKERREIF